MRDASRDGIGNRVLTGRVDMSRPSSSSCFPDSPDRLGRVHSLAVSIRGSLAERYVRLHQSSDKQEALRYIECLLASTDPDLLRIHTEVGLVIGLASERG